MEFYQIIAWALLASFGGIGIIGTIGCCIGYAVNKIKEGQNDQRSN